MTLYLVWGSTYLAIRVVVETVPPLLAAGGRFLAAGVVLGGFIVLRSGPGRLRVDHGETLVAASVSTLTCRPPLRFSSWPRHVPPGLAAVLIASTATTYAYVNPIVALALGSAILSERVTPLMIVASAVVVLAVAVVVRAEARGR